MQTRSLNITRGTGLLGPVLLGCLTLALFASPMVRAAKPGPVAVTSPGGGALEVWGAAHPVRRPAAKAPTPRHESSDRLLDLPQPQALARMPVGRLHVGAGRVNPMTLIRGAGGAYLYTVRAQVPGIVEYLYSDTGIIEAGKPVVRLYDLGLLPDLRVAESAMSRFAGIPFVIAPRQPGLPPLIPGADFPQPTAIQRLLGLTPWHAASPRPGPATRTPGGSEGTGLARSSGLSRSYGLAPAAPRPGLAGASRSSATAANAPSRRDIVQLSEKLAEAHERLGDAETSIAKIDEHLRSARQTLGELKEDMAARQRLYDQGVLARKVYESAQSRYEGAQTEVRDLERKRSELVSARSAETQRCGALQEQIGTAVTARGRQSAALAEAESTRPAPLVVAPAPAAAPTPAPRSSHGPARRSAARPAPAATPGVSDFPAPSGPRRPELRALPRLPQAVGNLRTAPEVPPLPEEVKHLSAPRWTDQPAKTDAMVVRQVAAAGDQVPAGAPSLQVANTQWARIYADVARSQVGQFPRGAPVQVTFDDYPGIGLDGWINAVLPLDGTDMAKVEMVVVCREGYYGDDAYSSLQWLALAAPLVTRDTHEPLAPAVEAKTAADLGIATIYTVLPLVPTELGPAQEKLTQAKQGEYVGVMRMAEMSAAAARGPAQNSAQSQRLAALRKWREGFAAGITSSVFGKDLVLGYPQGAETARAIERMACGRVTHEPNRCARTLREALGWGLGDAADWMTRLPQRGYRPRKDGLARPGDILVWPFTYGPRRTQHIGIAVNQGGKLMLLSNLGGTLGTTELCGGYIAFWYPQPGAKMAAAGR